MDAFWCILLSTIVLRWWWKRNKPLKQRIVKEQPGLDMEAAREMQQENNLNNEQKEKDRQRERDIAELRKQGYTDELIAVIMPTINNGQ